MKNAQIIYYLDLDLNESYTYTAPTSLGYTASSKFTLIEENATVQAAGKTFTCNVYDQVTKSNAPGALDVEGQLWFDKNYGLIKADLTTVKMELIKINK